MGKSPYKMLLRHFMQQESCIKCQKLLFQIIGIILFASLLVACGTSSVSVAPTMTCTPESPTATPTPEPPTDTPTPEPTDTPPPTERPTPVPTATLTPTDTPTPTETPTPSPTYTVSGLVFHDLNGNGIYDTAFSIGDLSEHPDGYLGAIGPLQESPIAGAVIRLGQYEITSDSNGGYELHLSAGTYDVAVQKSPYRFYFPSMQEIKELSQELTISVSQNTTLDLGLGVGPLTLPYRLSEKELFRLATFTDIDPLPNSVGIYNSYPYLCSWWRCTGDAHRGIDIHAPEGTVVVAAAPGMVYSVGTADDGSAMVIIIHTQFEGLDPWLGDDINWANRGFQTSYQHLDRAFDGIQPGVMVSRGQPVGYLNDAVHLHIDAQLIVEPGNRATRGYVDLYRDTFHDQFVFLQHDSLYGYSIKISQGSPGYWTADNLPHFGQN